MRGSAPKQRQDGFRRSGRNGNSFVTPKPWKVLFSNGHARPVKSWNRPNTKRPQKRENPATLEAGRAIAVVIGVKMNDNDRPLAIQWHIEAAERFLAALYRAAQGCPVATALERVEVLPVDAMPTSEHRAVFQALCGFAEAGVIPTPCRLRNVARKLGYAAVEKLLGNPFNEDLIDRLPMLECTAAGLANFARLVNDAYRDREFVRWAWNELVRRGVISTPPITTSTPRRTNVRVKVA